MHNKLNKCHRITDSCYLTPIALPRSDRNTVVESQVNVPLTVTNTIIMTVIMTLNDYDNYLLATRRRWHLLSIVKCRERERERQRQRETERDRDRDTERDRHRERESLPRRHNL